MNKFLITLIALALAFSSAKAQSEEPTDSLTRQLQEVIVTANQPATRLVGSTLVSTIAGSNLQDLGTCLDVLKQLPMITVNDDAVSVVGKGAPEIYIDGRPLRDGDELRQLQSSNIRRVELLMAPGAMYDSNTQAVLKITIKHSFIDGLSLTERAESTKRRKWSANEILDLNYHTGGWDLFATGTFAHNNSLIKGTTTNTLIYQGKEMVVGSSQHKSFPSNNGLGKAGFNYSKDNQSFGAYYRYSHEHADYTNIGTEWLDNDAAISRRIGTEIGADNHLVSAYYDNTFADKYLLHFDGNFRSSATQDDVATTYPDNISDDVNSHDNRKSTLWAGKLYLNFPLWKGDFTLGTQDSYTHTKLDYRMLNDAVSQYIPSSLTDSRQTSLAAFATWDRTFGKFSLTAGLRYEYIDYLFRLNGVKDTDVSRRDNLLTPDISLGWQFNEESQISLSYKMATVRPPYSQLTGSLSYTGLHEIEGGNPTLRDEHNHTVQLFGMWKEFMLQGIYSRSLDTYGYVKRLYPAENLQLLMQPINLDVSSFDLYLVWNKPIKAWTPNVTIGMHKQWLDIEGTKYNKPMFVYYFENMISLPKGFFITLDANGQTSGDMHTNRFGTTWFTLDASISKSFLNKSLQVKLSATDIFNTANNDWTMNTYGVFVDKHQSYDRRGISLSVTYRLHPRKSQYKGNAASEAEMNRL